MASRIQFLIDECLSPKLVELASRDIEITHVNFRGLSRRPDAFIAKWCVTNDFALVTNNGRDFRAIYQGLELHPGLAIVLPSVATEQQIRLFHIIIEHIVREGDLVNKFVEIDLDGTVSVSAFPSLLR
jgi:predicted nuclease of predicted toxin-antitoxin system